MKTNFLDLVVETFYINISSFLEVSGTYGISFLGPSVPWIILNTICSKKKGIKWEVETDNLGISIIPRHFNVYE